MAVTQGWWRPPRAGCSRRGEVTGGRDRCALLECARQSSSDAAMVTCVRGDGKGRAAARAHRGLSLDGEWGERESSQARVPVMRDDIDSWSRPRLAERLKVVGLGRRFLISGSVGGRATSGWRAGGRFEKQKTENGGGAGPPLRLDTRTWLLGQGENRSMQFSE